MAIIRPRLNDYHGLMFTQKDVSFAIPFLDEDIPLYVDPFLLWKSPSQQDSALHGEMIAAFNKIGRLYSTDKEKAINLLVELSECNEAGLGNSITKKGLRIGKKLAADILDTFESIPQINQNGFTHFEEIQLLVEGVSKDRISDIACNLLKSFLIDYTIQESNRHNIPTDDVELNLFDSRNMAIHREPVQLPVNPENGSPILLIPKRWLRFTPWLNIDNYYKAYTELSDKLRAGQAIPRVEILDYNRKNYDAVQSYVAIRQRQQSDCKNDPLFSQIPVLSSKRRTLSILKLNTGKENNADKKYEEYLPPLLASMLYPNLDFAGVQEHTSSNVLIRDLIFYNNTSHDLLKEIYERHKSRQIVFELKNVKELNNDHVDQLNRYLNNEFGSFGVLFTRNDPPQKVFKNTIDLWAGQRRCILILTDADLVQMSRIYESKQREPIDVINKKYVEFIRACPS